MAKIEAKTIVYFAMSAITFLGVFAALAKTYYLLPVEMQHQTEKLQELKDICKELDTKVDSIDHAILHNNRDMLWFTKEFAEIKESMREIKEKISEGK